MNTLTPAFGIIGILYAVFTIALAVLAVYALVLTIIFLRLRIAELKRRWRQRLNEVAACLAAGHELPRHNKTDNQEERTLGVWLHTQRIDHRAGKLTPYLNSIRAQVLGVLLGVCLIAPPLIRLAEGRWTGVDWVFVIAGAAFMVFWLIAAAIGWRTRRSDARSGR